MLVGPVGAVGTIGFGDEQVTATANVSVTGVTATISTSTPTAPAAVTLTGEFLPPFLRQLQQS